MLISCPAVGCASVWGVGWNYVEYEALGQDFGARGARQEEQIELLRRLFTEPVVDFSGRRLPMRSLHTDISERLNSHSPGPIRGAWVAIVSGRP